MEKLVSNEKHDERWKEHFEEILNRGTPTVPTELETENMDVNIGEITVEEFVYDIRKRKGGSNIEQIR